MNATQVFCVCEVHLPPCPNGKLKTARGSYAKSIKLARKFLPPFTAAVVWGEGAPCLNNNIPGGLVNEQWKSNMEPNLVLVTGSFFTGKSKAGSALRERLDTFWKGNFIFVFILVMVAFVHKIQINLRNMNEWVTFDGGFFDLSFSVILLFRYDFKYRNVESESPALNVCRGMLSYPYAGFSVLFPVLACPLVAKAGYEIFILC